MTEASYIEFVIQTYQNYIPVSAPLIILSVALIVIAQVIGRFLNMDQLLVWSKLEIFEIFFSAFILFMFLFVLTTINEIASSVIVALPYGADICSSSQSIPCHIKYAKGFLNSMFLEIDYLIFRQLAWYSVINILTEIEFSLEVGMVSKPWSPFSILDTKERMLKDSIGIVFTGLLTIKIIENLFTFISLFLFPVLLVSGVFLRILKYTRRLGGLLIAIALVSHYITPMPFIVGGMLYNQYRESQGIAYNDLKPVLYKAETSFTTGVPSILKLNDTNVYNNWKDSYESEHDSINNTVSVVDNQIGPSGNLEIEDIVIPEDVSTTSGTIASSLLKIFSFTKYLTLYIFTVGFDQGKDVVDFIYGLDTVKKGGILDVFGTVLAYSFFFTFISLLASIAAVRSLSETFGGDVEIAGLTRLV